MSQTTFDPTTPGGSSEGAANTTSTGQTGQTGQHGQSARHRAPRRGRSSAAKAAENAAQTTAQLAAEREVAAPASATAASDTPAATASAAEERPAAEPRGRRSRGGAAKRPAPRGKSGAQLIITKAPEEERPADQASDASATAETPETAALAGDPTMPVAQALAEPQEPVVVPVVTAEPTSEPPAPPRKTRFGLPRRLQQQPSQPAASAPATAASAATVAEPAAEPAISAPATEAAPAEPGSPPTPRYRFDRSRRTTIPGATPPRPERLSSQRSGLYTDSDAATEPVAEPAAESAPREHTFDLPSLDALIGASGGAAGSDLPTLAFESPAARAGAAPATADHADEAEQAEEGEPSELAEGAEGASGASRRRRRRRRSGPGHNGAHGADQTEQDEALDDLSQLAPGDDALDALFSEEPSAAPSEPSEPSEPEAQPAPRGRNTRFGYPGRASRRPAAEPNWEAAPQQPAQQALTQQPAAEVSPYSSPEPSFARGFGPAPSGAAMPVRESYPRTSRVERGVDPVAAAVAQVGAVIREAIGAQTDRLLTEMRHAQPPAINVSIPNAMSTERVGVFVDVANIVYSLRGMRFSVDFGRLLDFLRANRRLARAQAYAPTNPEPGAEQSFLNAVKGMGYRITTKNYKTFSNGAKKADLDLDLCMDIVRLVEAKAVDTIVLVSGDSDFLPLLDFCYDHGVRVEVAAFDDAASMILRQSCDLFINLSLVDTIRG